MVAKIPLGVIDDAVIAANNAAHNAQGTPDPLKRAAEKARHKAPRGRKREDGIGNTDKAITPEMRAEIEAAARDAEQRQKISGFDKAMGITGTTLSIAGFAPILLGIPNGIGSAMGWVANKTAGTFLKPVGKILNPVKKVLQAPSGFLDKTFSQVGESMGSVGTAIGEGAQGAANLVAPAVQFASDKSGVGDRMRAKHIGKAAIAHEKAAELARDVNVHINSAPAEVRGHLKAMKTAIVDAATHHDIPVEEITRAKGAIAEALEKGTVKAAELKPFNKFLDAAESVVGHSNKASGWKNVGAGIKKIPGTLAKAPVGNTVMAGSFIALSGMSMVSDTRTAAQELATLKTMYTDMTGDKTPSTLKLLLGKVPAPVQAARGHLIKNYGLKQIFDVANIALNVAQFTNPKFGLLKSAVAFGGMSAASKVTDSMMGPSSLPVYQAFRDAYGQSNGNLSAEYYAAFVGAVSPELRERGGAESKFAQELATQYAAEKASPKQMLQEIENGGLMERVHALITAASAKPKAGAREVVGKHTGMLQQANANEASQGASRA